MPRLTRTLALAGALSAAAILLPACEIGGPVGPVKPAPQPGDKLPEITLTNLEGEQVEIFADVIGDDRYALVDVWATWCAPCLQAMPHLQALHNQYKDRGFKVVGLMTDQNATDIGARFVAKQGVTYPMLLDDAGETFSRQWGRVSGVPFLLLVDREGNVVETWQGWTGGDQLDRSVAALFAGGDEPGDGETSGAAAGVGDADAAS
jgi:thiol-disulfide isomerase/thioredoxin